MAADKGEVLAMKNVAIFYYAGQGTEKNKLEGLYWYLQAAEKGDEMAYKFLTQ